MISIKRGVKLLLENRALFLDSIIKNFLFFLPDKLYLTLRYRLLMGTWIQWKHPKTFTEKIQWLKIYDRRPEYVTMVDKYAVKKYVADLLGSEYVIPILGVWNSPEEIEWENLPKQFVLKTTQGGGSGGVVICRDKDVFDKQAGINRLNNALKYDIYTSLREWPYKNVPSRIIAERFIASDNSTSVDDLTDYKFFCFNGEPRFCQVIRDRSRGETIDFYDMEWNHQAFVGLNPKIKNGQTPVSRPKHLDNMIMMCRTLSKNIPFVRVDMYVVDEVEFFGELTFYPASGIGTFTPKEWQYRLGELIILPENPKGRLEL